MIWKSIKKKTSWEFNQEYQKEGLKKLNNPVRGWYAIYTFHIEEKIVPEELKWSLRDNESIALVRVDISKYREMAFDQPAIDHLKMILNFFKKYEKDVILRLAYDIEGNGRKAEPDKFELVLKHLRQIGEILSKEQHSVFLVQGFLVGSWGEMHDSMYLSKNHLLRMWECLKPHMKDDMYLAVRTPVQWRMLVDQEKSEQVNGKYKICLFDDAIFGSENDLGTFGTMTREAAGWESPWNAKEELDFLDKINSHLPCGGEVIFPMDQKEIADSKVIRRMSQMHLSYLNAVYDQKLLNLWKEKKVKDSTISLYDHIGEHLGYRFVAEDVQICKIRRKEISIKGWIKNTGFASLIQKADLIVFIENEEGQTQQIVVDIDLSQMKSGEKMPFIVKLKRQNVKLFLQIKRRTDQRTIFFANKNATDKLYLGYLRQKN